MTPSKIERAEGGVPEWAIVRAMEEMGYSDPRQFAVDVIAADGVEYKAELAFARYIAEHEEEPVDPHSGALGLACGEVADAVFYHMSDVQHRSKLALALLALSEEIRRGVELAREQGA